MMWQYGNWPWMMFGGLFMVIVWAGFIALVTWIVLKLVRSSRQGSQTSPLDIARQRYARGEITREQFEQIKKDLGG